MDELLAHMMPDNVVLHHPAISPFSPRLPRHRRSQTRRCGAFSSMAGRKSQIGPGLRRHHVELLSRLEADPDIDKLDVWHVQALFATPSFR